MVIAVSTCDSAHVHFIHVMSKLISLSFTYHPFSAYVCLTCIFGSQCKTSPLAHSSRFAYVLLIEKLHSAHPFSG